MPRITVEYTVDDNVPIPVHVREKGIPLESLEVGQSIEFPPSRRSYVQQKASRLKKERKMVFTVRIVDDTHCRVWRKA